MPPGMRTACCALADNMSAIETWRASLSNTDKTAQNNPQVVIRSWLRSTRKTEQPSSPLAPQRAKRLAVFELAAPVHWPQAAMRRAHQAMLDSRSRDLLTLARAVQGAIRHERDLLDLLPPEPATASPRPGRRRTGHASEAAHA